MLIAYLINKLHLITQYYQWIYIVLVTEAFAVTVIFCSEIPKKRFYWLRLAGCFFIAIGIAYLCALVRTYLNYVIIKMLITMFIYLGVALMIGFLTKIGGTDGVFATIATLTARETGDNLYIFFLLAFGLNPNQSIAIFQTDWLNYIFYDLVHLIMQLLLYLILRKKLLIAHDLQISKTIIITSFILLFTSIVAKNVITSTSTYDRNYYMCIGLTIILCFGVFVLITNFLEENQHRQDRTIITHIMESEGKQYESLRLNMETINAKAHDIKHQLEYLQDKLAEEDLAKLKESVKSYDNTWNTGNTVIDTLLYDRTLRCNSEGIRITCLCDPSAIDKMNKIHLYYLVENVIDNAIEAVQNLPEDKRIIALTISRNGERTVIEENNYFEGERNIYNNRIFTNKKDKKSHGYGIKSIRMIADLYDGNVNLSIHEDMFFISVSFVQKERDDSI